MAWNGSEMRCPKCNKYLPDRCTCNGPSMEQQRNEDGATPPSPSTAEVDELLGRYWEIAYSEGKTGESRGSEAQEVLSSLCAALASRPAVEAGELPPLPAKSIGSDEEFRILLRAYENTPYQSAPALFAYIDTVIARAALATKPATSAPGPAGDDRAALEGNFRAGIQQVRATLCGEPGTGASAQKEE